VLLKKGLRKIYKPRKELNGEWRILHNVELKLRISSGKTPRIPYLGTIRKSVFYTTALLPPVKDFLVSFR
jgi:hypothetical protein